VRNFLQKYNIVGLISVNLIVLGIMIAERPKPDFFLGGRAMTVRQSKDFDALNDICGDQQKGFRVIAVYIHRSTLGYPMSVVMTSFVDLLPRVLFYT